MPSSAQFVVPALKQSCKDVVIGLRTMPIQYTCVYIQISYLIQLSAYFR